MPEDYRQIPPNLPVPIDDGAADHLEGMEVPSLRLPSTVGGEVNLPSHSELTVLYVYPRTGTPGRPSPDGWDAIPGARGCTPQSCAFRDQASDFEMFDARLLGLSAQTIEEQAEFAAREHIPYPLLSDSQLRLADELNLPTFTTSGMHLYRRLTMVISVGHIKKVFYPVFPPDENAQQVLDWLEARSAVQSG